MAKAASDVGFVDLHGRVGVSHLNVFPFLHDFPDPMCHIPGRLVHHADDVDLAG
jgi:hypothetical protein